MSNTSVKAVLVIDDSALVRRQVREALSTLGMAAIEASDGREALTQLDLHDVVLIITDFMMPAMSGLELITAVRARAVGADTPIIVLSTVGSGALVQQAWSKGVTAWLKKPFRPAILVAAVTSLLAENQPCAS